MKNLTFISFVFIILIAIPTYSQEDCKVLQADINKEYKGDCAKGLANGKGIATGINTYQGEFKKGYPNGTGTITYADGSTYSGEWKKGMKNGEGKFIQTIKGKDSITEGVWKNDKYIGLKKVKEYDVIKKISVQRYMIRKIGDDINQVTIQIKNKGMSVPIPKNIIGSNGNLIFNQGKAIFENITTYPFTCDMNYEIQNSMGGTSTTVEFSFKILVKGNWIVELSH